MASTHGSTSNPLVLALLLAPHRRCLKTLARDVLGRRVHVATISRRLINPRWRTRQWYQKVFKKTLHDYDRWERQKRKREEKGSGAES